MWIVYLFLIIYLLYQTTEHYYTYDGNCSDLKYEQCLRTPKCGWLRKRYPLRGNCVSGTAQGPLNYRLLPEAEEGRYKNYQLDFWTYYQNQEFPKCSRNIL